MNQILGPKFKIDTVKLYDTMYIFRECYQDVSLQYPANPAPQSAARQRGLSDDHAGRAGDGHCAHPRSQAASQVISDYGSSHVGLQMCVLTQL